MKKIYILLLLLPVSGAFAQQSCNNFYTAISPDGKTIYFSSDRHGSNYEIYRADIDGISNLVRLTFSSYNNYYPSLSPDGSKILFQQNDYGSGSEIFMMNNDGTGLTQITNNNVMDGLPSFSKDGLRILFTAWDDSQYPEIFTMDTDGNTRVQITNIGGAYWQYAPQYNPSGDKIFFEAGFNADNHIVMMDLDGSNWVDITPPNSFGYSEGCLSFNYDGSKIAFYTSEYLGYANGSDIVIADVDGSDWVKITNSIGGEYNYYPVFNVSDDRIFFSRRPSGGKFNINTMKEDGSDVLAMTNCSQVGIEDLSTAGENTYFPNPVHDLLNIYSNEARVIKICDITGRLVLLTIPGKTDVSGLNNGIYTIEFLDGDCITIKSGKLIKN